jgi:hypothetical protein
VTDFPDNSILLGLAEVCATLLGFVGVVLVLGRRSTGEWDDMERARFVALLTGSIGALALALLPLVLSDANALHAAVVICGVSFYLIGKNGLHAIKDPRGSTSIAAPVTAGSALMFLAVGLADLGVTAFAPGVVYLSAILWLIAVACIFFVRLISVTGVGSRV